jgi:hypothetical protein
MAGYPVQDPSCLVVYVTFSGSGSHTLYRVDLSHVLPAG